MALFCNVSRQRDADQNAKCFDQHKGGNRWMGRIAYRKLCFCVGAKLTPKCSRAL